MILRKGAGALMYFPTKKGFTLIELLVVMSIIGILVAALVVPVTNAVESARTAKCKANLKNLAQAATSYAVATTYMPWAGSFEWYDLADVDGQYVNRYYQCNGWVGWTGSGTWPNTSSQCGRMSSAKFYGSSSSDTTPYLSITNGSLWSYSGGDLSTYVCETHKKAAVAAGLKRVLRSYEMNGFFWYSNNGNGRLPPKWVRRTLDSLSDRGSAANLLLFAELPAYKSGHVSGIDTSDTASDGVLEAEIRTSNDPSSTTYYNKMTTEVIGFNHTIGKKNVAHVAFADGHVDVLMEPKGASNTDLKSLTKQLCNGDEIDKTLRAKLR